MPSDLGRRAALWSVALLLAARPVLAVEEEVAVDEAPAPAASPAAKSGGTSAKTPAMPAAKPAAEAPAAEPAVEAEGVPAADEPAATEEASAEDAPAAEAAPAAEEPAAEAAADEAPAGEADAAEESAPEAEPPAAETPAPAPVAVAPAPAPTAAVTPAAPAASEPESADEDTEIADDAPAAEPAPVATGIPTAPVPAAVEEAVAEPEAAEEPVAMEAAAEPLDLPSAPPLPTVRAEEEPAPAMIRWTNKASERAFTDFIRAGLALDPAAPPAFAARVTGTPDPARHYAGQSQELLVDGNWPRGQMFVAYRLEPGVAVAHYVGIVAVRQKVATGTARAVALKAADGIREGDVLLAFDAIRNDYERQRAQAGRRAVGGKPVVASVRALSDGRSFVGTSDQVLCVDRGSAEGIGLAWLCEFAVPGKDRQVTWGRVVKVDRHACHVALMKLYQPVRIGDEARLSDGAVPARARL